MNNLSGMKKIIKLVLSVAVILLVVRWCSNNFGGVISLPGGKTLEISAPGNGPETTDVRKIVWNGKTLADNFLDIAELKKGGELRFWLSPGDHLTASR